MKRGTDHIWWLIRYPGDMAIYAKCKCGYQYVCSITENGIKAIPTIFHNYCPYCGARKKCHTVEIEKSDKSEWELYCEKSEDN